MTTVAQIETRAERWLRERVANQFTAGDRLQAISDAHIWLAEKLANIPGAGYFRTTEDETLAADATTIAISALTTGTFAQLIDILWQNTASVWHELEEIPFGQKHRYIATQTNVSRDEPPFYLIEGDNFEFHPVSNAARTLRFIYRYRPAVFTATSDTLTTPTWYDSIVEMRAAQMLLGQEGTDDNRLDALLMARLEDMYTNESGRHTKGTAEVIQNVSAGHYFDF